MLDIEYPKLENNSFNNLDLLMNEPKIKINLRGNKKDFFTKAGKILSLILPTEANTSTHDITDTDDVEVLPHETEKLNLTVEKKRDMRLDYFLSSALYEDKGYYSKPTIFANVNEEMSIFREEIFGPVLSIISYKNLDDAIRIANNSEYGLSSFVCGKNKEQLIECARRIRAGQVHVNYKGGGTDAPFGGYKKSGNGREKAEWGLEEFLEVKAIMMD